MQHTPGFTCDFPSLTQQTWGFPALQEPGGHVLGIPALAKDQHGLIIRCSKESMGLGGGGDNILLAPQWVPKGPASSAPRKPPGGLAGR